MVEDLTVVGDDVPAAGRSHGLMPFSREIQNRQAPVTEPHLLRSVRPFAAPVRTAMRLHSRHAGQRLSISPIR